MLCAFVFASLINRLCEEKDYVSNLQLCAFKVISRTSECCGGGCQLDLAWNGCGFLLNYNLKHIERVKVSVS